MGTSENACEPGGKNHTVHFTDRCEPCRYANFFKRPLPSQKLNPVLKPAARLNLLLRMAIHHHIYSEDKIHASHHGLQFGGGTKNWLVSHITIRQKRNFKGGATHVGALIDANTFCAETFCIHATHVYQKPCAELKQQIQLSRMDLENAARTLTLLPKQIRAASLWAWWWGICA
jgi:hypothetical protein